MWCFITQLDGSSLMGNVIKVDRATERRERPQRDNRQVACVCVCMCVCVCV
jgi:hypothetical protein